ncbi:MAG: DUF2533 family protein [Bacilli bacterium]
MGEVHEAISRHSNDMHVRIKEYLALNAQREAFIDEAVKRCQNGQAFDTVAINVVTRQMNELAAKGNVPPQKLVSVEMVQAFVKRLQK